MGAFMENLSIYIIILIFIISLAGLSKATDFLVDNAVDLSKKIGISDVIIGATIVSLGTSLPELSTSILSIFNGSSDIAIGNAIGSIITNCTLILGVATLAGSIPVKKKTAKRLMFLIALIAVMYLFAFNMSQPFGDGHLNRLWGILTVITLPIYLILSFKKKKGGRSSTTSKASDFENHTIENHTFENQTIESHTSKIQEVKPAKATEKVEPAYLVKTIAIILVSAIVVAVSASLLVSSVQEVAVRLNVPEAIIASTIVALGTGLPELSTSYSSTRKGYGGLAFGNIIGANIMNILLVLGVPAAMTSSGIAVSSIFFRFQIPIAIVILLFILYLVFNTKREEITKKEGLLLLVVYVLFLLTTVFN